MSGDVGKSVAVSLQIYHGICLQKDYQIRTCFDIVISNGKGVSFFAACCTSSYTSIIMCLSISCASVDT